MEEGLQGGGAGWEQEGLRGENRTRERRGEKRIRGGESRERGRQGERSARGEGRGREEATLNVTKFEVLCGLRWRLCQPSPVNGK